MAISRVLLAQDESEDNQWLKVDHSSRFIVNNSPEWQYLFSPNSEQTNSSQIIKLAAQFDTENMSKVRMIGYLYNSKNGSVDSAATITFKVYKVENLNSPKWADTLITTLNGEFQDNSYFFADIDTSSLTGANLDGDTTLMIEGTATRLGITYRDRIYLNHLGVYDSITRLKQEVEFLDLTKVDE